MIGKLPVSTLLTLLLAVTACQKQPLAEPAPDALDPTSEYIIVFGDIQGYTVSSSAMKWYTSTQHWIQTAQHRYGNIRCVLHVGDTTEHNQEAEWLRFWDATDSTAKVLTGIISREFSASADARTPAMLFFIIIFLLNVSGFPVFSSSVSPRGLFRGLFT